MGATTQLPTECARGPTHPFESTADAAQAERRAYPSPDRAPAAEALETVPCGGLLNFHILFVRDPLRARRDHRLKSKPCSRVVECRIPYGW